MVRVSANCTVYGIGTTFYSISISVISILKHGKIYQIIPSAKSCTPLAFFHLTAELFRPLWFHQQILPSVDQNPAHLLRDIAYLIRRNYVVITVNISIKHFFEVEAVSALSELVDIFDLRAM